MKNILLTGSTGFLGTNFKNYIIKKNYNIYESNSKKNNIIDNNFHKKFNKIKFDYIFHFAAYTRPTYENNLYQSDIWNINNNLNFNIVNYWIRHQSQAKFITTSSSCIYSPDVRKVEKNCFKGEPEKNLYHYGLSKRNLMQSLISASLQYNLKYFIFIPTILYGPNFNFGDKHFIYDIIRKVHNAKLSNTFVEMSGTPDNKRDLVYIDDAIKIIFKCINLENNIINLTSKNHQTIFFYTKLISKLMDYDASKIIFKNYYDDGIKIRNLDDKKLNRYFKNLKKTPLIKGLKSTIKYFQDHYV